MVSQLPPSIRNLIGETEWNPDGGLEYMRGWAPRMTDSYEEAIDEAPESFESIEEALSFANAEGVYNDKNSFFYTDEDREMRNGEGFFQRPYCHRCITEADIDEPVNEIDVFIEPEVVEEDVDSFRPGYDKRIYRLDYSCDTHPEVGISRTIKNWEES